MSEKRKDSKGRVLKDGESQRANGTYDYRYTDIHKKRRCIYAKSLTELRKKEEELWRDLADGIDYAAGEMTVADLVDRYMNLKRGLKPNSLRSYNTAVKRIHADPFGQKAIKTVKLSDAKGWFVFLHDSGFKQNTIGILQSVVRPAFEMAVEDDIIRKNPFKFKLSDVVPKDAYVRDALTREQQEKYLQFVQDYGGNYYDDIVILMGTGLRVSELYGLTRADIDFERHCIHVRRQLCRTAEKPYFVTPPKTKSGIRNVPMTDTVCAALRRVVKARASTKVEALVDGCSGFLFLDKSGMPKVAMHLENYMRGVQGKFEKVYGKPVPRITPHVLRHTFCTNVQQAGLDVKSLQYLMGHSNASVTLDVYTHSFFLCIPRAPAAHPNHRERGRGDVRQTGIGGVCRLAAGVCGGAVPVVSAGAASRLCCAGGSAEHGHPAVARPAGQLLRCAGAAAHWSRGALAGGVLSRAGQLRPAVCLHRCRRAGAFVP